MALIRCPECKKKVSDQAPTCPHCGGPLDAASLMRADKRLGPINEELIRLQATAETSETGASIRVQKESFGNVSLHRDPSSKDHKKVEIDAAGALEVLKKLPDGCGEEAIWTAFKQREKRGCMGCLVVGLVVIGVVIGLLVVLIAMPSKRTSQKQASLSDRASQLQLQMTRQEVIAHLGSPTWAIIPKDTGEWALPDPRIKLELHWRNGDCTSVAVSFGDRQEVVGWDEGRVCVGGAIELLPRAEHSCARADRQRYCSISNNLVMDIQAALGQRGFNVGKADGVAGTKTKKAIRRYQKKNGLTVDGEPSESLLMHILNNRKATTTTRKTTAKPPNIIKGDYIGCLTEDALKEVVSAAVKKDLRQIQALLDARLCINMNGLRFSVVDLGFIRTKIRVYTGDGSLVLWTVTEATR